MQKTSLDVTKQKYLAPSELDWKPRVATALANVEPKDRNHWLERFNWALDNGFIPAGRIISNAGAGTFKPGASVINCTVSETIGDSIDGIASALYRAFKTLAAGCGIGYDFGTLRPKGAFVSGAGASTTGPLPFMDVYDKMCFTVSSAGGRRGAQMATFDVHHPDIFEFIRAKQEKGRFSQFNCSVLITDDFMERVIRDKEWYLSFPIRDSQHYPSEEIVWRKFPITPDESHYERDSDGKARCKIYRTIQARELWDEIMKLTYDYAEPGVLFINHINRENNNRHFEEIRACNPCGEQPLPPFGACLLGSINLTQFVDDPFTDHATFNMVKFAKVVEVATRMLDNVVEVNNLPLQQQRESIQHTRRHGLGILGLGSMFNMINIRYGSHESQKLTSSICQLMAFTSYSVGVELAEEKGPCPALMHYDARELSSKSGFLHRFFTAFPELKSSYLRHGCRFTHATSIAPTGTISLALANNASNGIEPTFAHHYKRNIVQQGQSTKEQVDVWSAELWAFAEKNGTEVSDSDIPETWVTTDNITADEHLAILEAAQPWIDSGISKTVNVPTDYPFEDFKNLYLKAWHKGLKGLATFRFNPEVFTGVLVKEKDLADTTYEFILKDGTKHYVKGNEKVTYEGTEHVAANLADAINGGYYGKL